MKNVILILSLAVFPYFVFTQELIFQTNCGPFAAKSLKISESDYCELNLQNINAFSFQDEMVYSIVYENGLSDLFNSAKIEGDTLKDLDQNESDHKAAVYKGAIFYKDKKLKAKEVKSLFAVSPDALNEYKKGRSLYIFSISFAAVGGGGLGWSLGRWAVTGNFPTGIFLIGASFTTVWFVTGIISSKIIYNSVNIFNARNSESPNSNISLRFGITNHGIGFYCLL